MYIFWKEVSASSAARLKNTGLFSWWLDILSSLHRLLGDALSEVEWPLACVPIVLALSAFSWYFLSCTEAFNSMSSHLLLVVSLSPELLGSYSETRYPHLHWRVPPPSSSCRESGLRLRWLIHVELRSWYKMRDRDWVSGFCMLIPDFPAFSDFMLGTGQPLTIICWFRILLLFWKCFSGLRIFWRSLYGLLSIGSCNLQIGMILFFSYVYPF